MQNLILSISPKESLLIFGIGLFFALNLTLLCYFLVDISLFDGLFFGMILGCSLSTCALLLTIALNRYILPNLNQKYWMVGAGIFSFLSGLSGTLMAYGIALALHVKMLVKFENHPFGFALFLGLISYVVAYLLYKFITINHEKEYHEKLLIESRLKSLERQLNPHFLFNALNSLAELLHSDTQKADTALLHLSHFLRSSMNESPLISLEAEIANVERYIALENIRFGDKIFLFLNIPELFLTHKIPKFSIQLIVENAIKHGFNKQNLGISIHVEQKEKLEICIENDGKPIEDNVWGIGLLNLQERLGLLCDGSLSVLENAKPTFLLKIGERL